MVDFVECDQEERQRQILFGVTMGKIYTHSFLNKTMLVRDRRRESTPPHPVSRGTYLLFLLAQPVVWLDWLPLFAQVCFWWSYILPMNAKSWFDSMCQLLHTEICSPEFPVWSQGGLPYNFLNDEKLMLEILLTMPLIHRKISVALKEIIQPSSLFLLGLGFKCVKRPSYKRAYYCFCTLLLL